MLEQRAAASGAAGGVWRLAAGDAVSMGLAGSQMGFDGFFFSFFYLINRGRHQTALEKISFVTFDPRCLLKPPQ